MKKHLSRMICSECFKNGGIKNSEYSMYGSPKNMDEITLVCTKCESIRIISIGGGGLVQRY